jgi:hypothetical protein
LAFVSSAELKSSLVKLAPEKFTPVKLAFDNVS